MTSSRVGRLASILGIVTAFLAWTAAAVAYTRTGQIRWSLLAAGVFFAVLPFVGRGARPGSPPE